MASVRMTHELRMQIRRNAENAYDLSNPEPKPNTEFVSKVREAIYNSPPQRFLQKMSDEGIAMGLNNMANRSPLPVINKDPVTGIDLRKVKHGNGRDYDETAVQFDTPLNQYWVTAHEHTRWGNPVFYVDDVREEDKLDLTEKFDAFQENVKQWRSAKYDYEGQIKELVDNCTTLKQLLEIWPAAESLVPSDKLAKMHVKVTRKERAQQVKEEINFDPSIANQTVLTAKLLGG